MTTLTWLVLVLVAVMVGISKTALPGLTVLGVALLASVMPARESTGVLLLLLLVGDLVAIIAYKKDADFRTLRRLLPTVLVGVALGGTYLHFASDGGARRVIGIVLLVMVALTVRNLLRTRSGRSQPVAEEHTNPLVRACYGTMAGFTTMVANAGGPVTSMYFLSTGFDVARFMGTTAWFFFTVNVLKLPVSIGIGVVNTQVLLMDLPLVPVVLASAMAGHRLARHLPKRVFDPIVLALTVVGSLWLLV